MTRVLLLCVLLAGQAWGGEIQRTCKLEYAEESTRFNGRYKISVVGRSGCLVGDPIWWSLSEIDSFLDRPERAFPIRTLDDARKIVRAMERVEAKIREAQIAEGKR